MTAIWLAPEPVRLVIVPIEAPVLSFTVSPTVKLAAPPAVALVFDPEVEADGAVEVEVEGEDGSVEVDGVSEAAGGSEAVELGGVAAPWLGDMVEPAP